MPATASDEWGLGSIVGFYRENVIGGPGSFLVEANDYNAFGEALKRKLLLELVAGPEMQEASRDSAIFNSSPSGAPLALVAVE